MSDLTNEGAEAAGEIAKTTGKAVDAARDLGGWLNRIFGEAVEHTVGIIWTDKVRERRIASSIYSWARLRTLLEKTEAELERKGISRYRIPPAKIMLPLLENATLEDDESLQLLWAKLLATALDEAGEEVHRKFVTILSELTRGDAETLEKIWLNWRIMDKKTTRSQTVTYGPGVDGACAHKESSIITLNRLGIIEPAYLKFKTFSSPQNYSDPDFFPREEEVTIPGDLDVVSITKLGEEFCLSVLGT